jgi:hypothetical protein
MILTLFFSGIRAISELPIVLKSSGTENKPGRNTSLRACFQRRVQGRDLDHRPSRLSNDKRLSARCLVHQTGQLRFVFMDVDRNHETP